MVAIIKMLFFFFLLSGCSGILIHQALDKDATLTPEQIEAYAKVGSKAFSCFQLSGPPPIGSTVLITIPNDAPGSVKFGPGCAVQMQ